MCGSASRCLMRLQLTLSRATVIGRVSEAGGSAFKVTHLGRGVSAGRRSQLLTHMDLP